MDKSWMQLEDKMSPEYLKGVEAFVEFAWKRARKRDMMVCPCVKCNNVLMRTRDDVEGDLIINGIVKSYTTWHLHGEKVGQIDDDLVEDFNNNCDNMTELLQDVFGAPSNDWVEEGFDEDGLATPSGAAQKFFTLLGDAKQQLYPGCEKYSKLSFLVKMLHIKVLANLSNKAITLMLELFKDALPEGETLPNSYYEAKKIIRDLGLDYVKIDACPNDCMLFWKNNVNADFCGVCGASRWKYDESNNVTFSSSAKRKKIAIKTLRYFPLKPRLQRLFMSSKTAKDMIWHHREREDDGKMRHPADSKAWKDFDAQHPLFGSDPRNVRLGLATDGFNPFGNMNVSYSIWPVILVPYNLPPWLCMKKPFSMLSLLIPGPKAPGNDIDVYLQPLIEELKELWEVGAETYDAFGKENFTMRAALMWTINDFPAYANLSGWSTKGAKACPSCNVKTDSYWLPSGFKHSYMGHRRWLPLNHPWRSNPTKFNNYTEYDPPPEVLTGDAVLEQLRGVEQVTFGKFVQNKKRKASTIGDCSGKKNAGCKRKRGEPEFKTNWKKHSIFFELPYWKTLLIRHNLDVMHIEKNFCESLVWTLLNMERSKDNAKSRQDLKQMNIRAKLHLQQQGGRVLMPAACFTMSSKERESFCQFLKDVKVPDGFSSNLARCAQPKERKIIGMKSHDYHVLMQQILPIAIRGLLPHKVCEALAELSNFFRELCSKVLDVEDLEQLESKIALILCKLEMIFPPSFFDVMEHLPIHLAYEAKIAGPVQYRWNYFVERLMHTLQLYVKNKSRPEGSIAEAYLAEECLTFCSRYLSNIETRFNRPERNFDCCDAQKAADLSVFKQKGRPLGKPIYQKLTIEELEQARLYVLQNCSDVDSYIEEHRRLVSNEQLHKTQFSEWFEKRVTQLYNEGASEVSEELLSLARGPDRNVASFKGYIVNGYRFHTKDCEIQRKTQNSGVKVAGDVSNGGCLSSANNFEYYGVLRDVVELRYIGGYRIVLFKCDWWDIYREGVGIYKDKLGFTSVNFSKTIAKDEPFVLACQAEQVFYMKDNCRQGWHVVVKTQPRDFYNMSSTTANEEHSADANEGPLQQNDHDSSNVPIVIVDDNIDWTRDDIDDLVVDLRV